ncbi:NUDIX domain-containing protein [Actinoplanes sp. CA-030573]|uniref:NUDIX domain-containing protein n=1 Tax=Actinoplanes sp. CA-030573 TaxID=3239898 RepID=UPI003D8E6EF3
MAGTPLHPVDVLLLLTSGKRVLLGLRAGTGYADGQWNLPSGKLELGEDAIDAVVRESREEIGIALDGGEVRAVATVQHRGRSGLVRLGLAFAAEHDPGRHGEPFNAEPHKCARIGWFPRTRLPAETFPSSAACVRAYLDDSRFVRSG